MSEATIVALVILGSVVVIMCITILKSGAEAAIKMWGVMGALTGVAFGSITSHYFTNKINQQEISQSKAEKAAVVLALRDAAMRAVDANKFVSPLASMLKGERTPTTFLFSSEFVRAMPESKRAELADRIGEVSMQLIEIKKLEAIIKEGIKVE